MYLQVSTPHTGAFCKFALSRHASQKCAECASSVPQEEEKTASQAILKTGYIDVIIHSQRCKCKICPAHQQRPQLKAQLGHTIAHV